MDLAMLHLSIPIADIGTTLAFYRDLLGCRAARIEPDRIDFEFFGHHLVAQLSPEEAAHRTVNIGKQNYPLRHFGVIVPREQFERIAARLRAVGTEFAMPPEQIFTGTPREQQVLIALDPSGNAIELKSMPDPQQVFTPH